MSMFLKLSKLSSMGVLEEEATGYLFIVAKQAVEFPHAQVLARKSIIPLLATSMVEILKALQIKYIGIP